MTENKLKETNVSKTFLSNTTDYISPNYANIVNILLSDEKIR